MIKELDNSIDAVSREIREVFQASYAVEAKLLQAVDFPPLKRTISDFLKSTSQFFGYWKDFELVAVLEVKGETVATHIQSLVVHPSYFRLGIAQKMLSYIFSNFDSPMFTVETGIDNDPAVSLYEKNGFVEVRQWETEHGIRKVRFTKW